MGGSVVTAERYVPDEAVRLAAKRQYDVLGTPPDGMFDRIAALAARIFDVPIAIVSVVDVGRIWFKAHHGLDVTQVDREPSLCTSAIMGSAPWTEADAGVDPRTLTNAVAADEHGLRFYAGAPLTTHDGLHLGTVCVIDREPRLVTPLESQILIDLAALVVDELEVRRGAREAVAAAGALEGTASLLARTLQQSLLPPTLPDVPGLDVAARYVPAGSGMLVGGDFYDIFRLAGRVNWAVTIGDVSGHGVEAAKVTSLARHTIRAAAAAGSRPSAVLSLLNEALLFQEPPEDDAEPRFLTATYASLRLSDTDVVARVACAGHCPTLVRRADGRVDKLAATGLPLGWFDDAELRDMRIVLRPGDALVLYTDGINEARRDGVMFGDEAIVTVLEHAAPGSSAADLAELVETSAMAFGGAPPRDDNAVLVVAVPPA